MIHSFHKLANANTGEDSNLHRLNGGGWASVINEKRGGTGPQHIAAAIENPSTKIVNLATSAEVSMLPQVLQKKYKERTVVKINAESKPLELICKKLQIAKHAASTDADRKTAIINTFTKTGCPVITDIQLVRSSDKKVHTFLFVILPQGMEVDDMHELKASNSDRGKTIPLCMDELCFNMPMAGKKRCALHHEEHEDKMCSVCEEVRITGRSLVCSSCRTAANTAKDCKVPTCNNKRKGLSSCCSAACKKNLSNFTFCQRCDEKEVVDTSQFEHEDCQGLLCVDCWKKPFRLCSYCQVRIARGGVQCRPCEKIKKGNKTKKENEPEWFVEMKEKLS